MFPFFLYVTQSVVRASPTVDFFFSVGDLRQQLWEPKTENKRGFPFIVQKSASSAAGSDGSFLDAACTRKKCFSHIALHRCHVSSPHRTRITAKLGDSVCSTKMRVFVAKFEGRRWSVSRGLAWGVGA